MKIILASNSPRRKELLEQVGIEYTVMPADVDEKIDIDNPADIVLELSDRKSGYICEQLKDTDEEFCVIGADTVVACDGMVLGKPKDKEDACSLDEPIKYILELPFILRKSIVKNHIL